MTDYDESPAEAFSAPPADRDPAEIAKRLLELPEHAHLLSGEARIGWLLRRDPKVKGGREVLGTAHMPQVQGQLKECFDWLLSRLFTRTPDFLVILDRGYWLESDDRLREILVYHELMHCVQLTDRYRTPRFHSDGSPVWGLRGHDVEEFTAVVRRYGQWSEEIKQFVAAAKERG